LTTLQLTPSLPWGFEVPSEKKALGLLDAVSIGVGGMIGAGIFSILGYAVKMAGSFAILSFLLAGLVALLSTYSYAKLSVRYPSPGGAVDFLIKGFGDGVISGGLNFLLWIGYVFAIALYAKAFGGYASALFPKLGATTLAVGVILLFTAVNVAGAKVVGRSEVGIVAVKVFILLFFALIGITTLDTSKFSVSVPPSSILFASGLVFISYEGFGIIANTAGDISDPDRNLPRAFYTSVIFVIFIYVLVCVALVGNLSYSEIVRVKEYALAAAAEPILGRFGFDIMAIAALFSTSSAINATMYGGVNVSYMVARYGQMPKAFEKQIGGRNVEGVLLTSAAVVLLVLFFNLDSVAMMGSMIFLVIYGSVSLAHMRLYRETGANPKVILLSLLSCLFVLAVLVYYEMLNSPFTLKAFLFVLAYSFIGEWSYRLYSGRRIRGH